MTYLGQNQFSLIDDLKFIIKIFDTDKKGTIEFEEFLKYMSEKQETNLNDVNQNIYKKTLTDRISNVVKYR